MITGIMFSVGTALVIASRLGYHYFKNDEIVAAIFMDVTGSAMVVVSLLVNYGIIPIGG